MSYKLLLVLTACLPLALAGCGGGGGAGSSAPARSPNFASGPLAPATTGGVFLAAGTPSPVTLDGKNEPVAAAARAYNAALAEALKTVNAAMLAAAPNQIETAREELRQALAKTRAFDAAARNSGSADDRAEARRTLDAIVLWEAAAKGRLTVAEAVGAYNVAANSAQRLYNNAARASSGRRLAAFAELDRYIIGTLFPLVETLDAAARSSGSEADQEAARAAFVNFRRFQATVSERLEQLRAGGNGGPSASPNDGAQPATPPQPTRTVSFNTSSTTITYSYWMARPDSSRILRDPVRPSEFPSFEIYKGSDPFTTDQLEGFFSRYVLVESSNRYSPLIDDSYRVSLGLNGVETFIRTARPDDSEDFGRYGGFLAAREGGSWVWAQSPRGWRTGTSAEYLRDTIGRAEYSGFATDAHLACREDAGFSSSSGWRWTGSYCEGNARSAAFGDRTDEPPAGNGVWRGFMRGDELSSGAAVAGSVTLRYSLPNNTLDVAIYNIKSYSDGGGTGTKSFRYEGPGKFTWPSLNVDTNGSFDYEGEGSSLGGWFFGPEAKEAAGTFLARFANACSGCRPGKDGLIVGAWAAKSSDRTASDSTFSGGYSGPSTGNYDHSSGGGDGIQCVWRGDIHCFGP